MGRMAEWAMEFENDDVEMNDFSDWIELQRQLEKDNNYAIRKGTAKTLKTKVGNRGTSRKWEDLERVNDSERFGRKNSSY